MNPIDQPEVLEPEEGEVNPWVSIWLKPNRAIEWLQEQDAGMFTIIYLIYLGGVQFGLSQAESKSMGDTVSSMEIFRNALLFSGIGGLVTYHILIGAIFFCSTFFDGKAGLRETQMAFAWSFVPSVASLIIKLLMYLIVGDELFTSTLLEGPMNLLYLGYTGLMWIFGIWHLILMVLNISYVQEISIGKTILVLVITAAIIILPIVALVLL